MKVVIKDGKMKKITNSQGFSAVMVLVVVFVLLTVGLAGWYVWSKNHKSDVQNKSSNSAQNKQNDKRPINETDAWILATTQEGAFSMKIPDGWSITKYPNDFLGSMNTTYKPGTPAVIEDSNTEYVGHSLRFRVSVSNIDDAGLGPQWASPQPGLEESAEDFSIGNLQGKRFKAIFSGDMNETVYEYVFDLGNNKKLDVVYTINRDKAEVDDVVIVEKAVKTITIN